MVGVKRAPRREPEPDLDPVEDHEEKVREALERADMEPETLILGKPTLDRLLVELDVASEMTDGGILLPPSARKNAQQGRVMRGTVLAMGPGMIMDDGDVYDVFSLFDIRLGSLVTWNEYGGREIDDKRGLWIVSCQDTLYVENHHLASLSEEGEEGDDEAFDDYTEDD